jgi:membrane-bound lytic murein transglycosylase D
MMKIKNKIRSGNIAIVTILLILISTGTSQAQFFSKKPSKHTLENEIIRLKRVIDSLKTELDAFQNAALSDTTGSDTINPGVRNDNESEPEQAAETPKNLPTDSLLHQWYMSKNLNFTDFEPVDLDSANIATDIPDSVFINRLKSMNSFITLPYNNVVKNHILFYTQKSKKIDEVLGLSNYYLPQFEEILDKYDLPKELKVMAIIESGLNPIARSRANARGMWQFMYRTALQYNLEINSFVDERMDPYKSGDAAARYLRDSYNIFGDWALAIASYNCGTGNVNKAIKRAGGARDFWSIYPYLPRETRGYVPSFVAALYTLKYYKEHRIIPKQIPMPAHVDTFIVRRPLHFGQISEKLGISKEDIANLNPQYINEIIPASETGNVLRLPFNYTSAFIENEDSLYTYKDSLFFNPLNIAKKSISIAGREGRSFTHKVKSGETLGGIALKYGVKVSELKSWNHIRKFIQPGQKLVIYGRGGGSSVADDTPVKIVKSGGYVVYTIRKGDTLYEIARKFDGVSVDDLLKLNGLTKDSKIKPGEKLKIKQS